VRNAAGSTLFVLSAVIPLRNQQKIWNNLDLPAGRGDRHRAQRRLLSEPLPGRSGRGERLLASRGAVR
jgi:hypothetical protein